MCGLVGVAGNVGVKEEAVFKRLLELDTIRGPHSTGVLSVDARGVAEVVKKVGTPWDLYQYKAFDEVMRGSQCVLMGHNRWATKGKITPRNAHPFEHGDIIGAHNGTLRNQGLLPDHKEFEVDSDNIFWAIHKIGVDETVKKTCGAFALTWYDAGNESMNFVRNDERPLWLCESVDSKTLFWASEPWMLEITLNLGGIQHKPLFQPKPGQFYRYPIALGYAVKGIEEPVVRDLELHAYPIYPKSVSTGTNVTVTGKSVQQPPATTTDKGKEGAAGKLTANDLVRQGEIEFFVSSLETSKYTGQRWLICGATQDNCEIELRIFTEDENLIEWLLKSTHLFVGKVKGFTSTASAGTFCTIDHTTIVEIFASDPTVTTTEEDEEFAVVYAGQIVNEDEYEIAVSCGCGNCKTIPTIEESEDLVWLDKFHFICGECKDMPVVRDFINEAAKNAVKH